MRILSWNINGIRTIPQYHPWNTFKSCEGILSEIGADIICFQEMKSSRAALPRDVALPGPFDSFFSFPASKAGYSGVAVYTDSRKFLPLKAEEGLSGKLQPKPSLSSDERVSPSYPAAHHIDAFPDESSDVPSSFDVLDAEGRALVVDFGLFVLINVYCPNETSDARLSFKMNYHLMLQERVRKLVEEEHREVIVLGDMNICATPLDHPEGHLASYAATFYDHPARAWFQTWLDPNGPMIDVVRTFWPERKGLFTCWNTKLSARETNYGTRVDYILVTRGLLPWVAHGDIQPSVKGSDHCPIYIDLHDEIVSESGAMITLRDAMKQESKEREPPRIAAKFWEEFSGKQTVLSSFFGKRGSVKREASSSSLQPSSKAPTDRTSSELPSPIPSSTPPILPPSSSPPQPPQEQNYHAAAPQPPSKSPLKASSSRPSTSTAKRKPSEISAPASKKKKKASSGQATIAAFFSKPVASKPPQVIDIDDDDTAPTGAGPSISASRAAGPTLTQVDADYRLACSLAAAQDATSILSQGELDCSAPPSSQTQSRSAWSSLFAPLQPPKCTVHDEPARLYTVNKQGPNKGKTFFLCSRPVGPGYDKGKNERLREEVDPRYRCNYFKWASEVKREALQKSSSS
ncbi:DNase I-like protein [Amylocystis lapponica]|nr:DNase I-like protein [Amylocystis lapponica]